MSYQVLARKWRPQHFGQLVGQEHVKTALSNALNSSRLHHAYLFTGTRGVGKTTIARIFAKSLNCETGITAEPCGVCQACQEIDAGHFVDLLEIDAASRTKVEDTRDLLDNVQYAPSRGRFKVYLIDEVHMLSKHSFNALLKTLEEPPPHVKFLLATTDPQKLPVTVLSRCLQFNLKALSQTQIKQHLVYILQQEAIPFDESALSLLAKAARGSLRDSLSLTDQAIAQSNSHLTLEQVRNMLGYLEQSWAQLLLQAVIQRDIEALQQQLAALVSQHSDFSIVLDDMLSLLHLAALTQLQPAAASLSEQAGFVQELAATIPPETIQLYYQLLISGKKELPYAPDLLTGVEMALLRALAFIPATGESPSVAVNKPVVPAAIPKHVQPDIPIESKTHLQPEAEEAGSAKSTESAESTESAPVKANPQPVAPEATAESVIDPVTARIMARRGVVADTDLQPEKARPETPKKPERQTAPFIIAAAKTAPPIAESATAAPQIPVPAPLPERIPPIKPLDVQPAEPALPATGAVTEEAPVFYEESEEDSAFWLAQQQESAQFWQLPERDEPQLTSQFSGEITEENFSVRFAAQVDSWAARVDQLDTGGLSRLFLLHSSLQLQGSELTLTVAQTQQHLDTAAFRSKLQQLLNQTFGQELQLNLIYQAEVPDSPLAIQQRIELERRNYVTQLLQQDPNIIQLQQLFSAELLPETIQVN
ncbi:DNA polymerase III subunit gamma/tau [Chromatiaceae bacterium AAb-1]|nr:DNA polymerase III subunit gamma/tau [Chromatiaceae bacterium AAb-1]